MCRVCASSDHYTTFAADASSAVNASPWYPAAPRVWASATTDPTTSSTTATGGAVSVAPASINTPDFDIVVAFTGDAQYLEYFTAAARMWELVITGDLPSDNVSPPTGPGFIDDLYIDASAVPIDGPYGVLGSAGPTWLRNGSLLPSTGVMEFDSADLAELANDGTLQAVIMHEMGHVLGIGTIWETGMLDLVSPGPNYAYSGAAALAEYRLLSNNAGAASVPVETDGGSGTAGGHWDDSLFGNELMTGYVNASSNPLSRMSIAALRDMGYTVDLGYADPYWLSSTPAALRDDVAGNYNSTTTIAIGGTRTGVIELDEDNDWFRVDLTGGSTYTFEMRGAPSGGGTLGDAMLRLRALDGEILAFNNNAATTDSHFVFTVANTGPFYLDASAAGSQTGSYTLSVEIGAPPLFTTAADTVTLATPDQAWDALAGNDAVTGTTGNDTINGNDGNDTLTGGAGVDQLTGGAGDDVFYVDLAGDLVLEAANGGNDIVFTTTSYTLAHDSHIESLRTTNPAGATVIHLTGNGFANALIGNAAGNILNGGDGADTLSGMGGNDTLIGGTGADRLVGGLGDDAYYVDTSADLIIEAAGQGTDTIYTTLSYTLNAAIAVEVLRTTSQTGLAAINLTGNGVANTLIGNAAGNSLNGLDGADTLSGLEGNDTLNGGTGADHLVGGLGNDAYYVDSAADFVLEAVGQGTDTVYTTLSYTLNATSEIEVVRTTSQTGLATINLAGNAFANTLIGNAAGNTLNGDDGADTLSGLEGDDTLIGGTGVDRLVGGLGNDAYYVDNAVDFVLESVGQGTDTIFTTTSYTLSSTADIEVVRTTSQTGLAAINLTGNALDNTLFGTNGSNILSGMDGNDALSGLGGNDTLLGGNGADRILGGLGNDQMTGGAGTDRFMFDTAPATPGNVDVIVDFTAQVDQVWLARSAFAAFTATGAMAASAFHAGPAATTAAHRILYDSLTGTIAYDADGAGGAGAVHFATIAPNLAPTAQSFWIY